MSRITVTERGRKLQKELLMETLDKSKDSGKKNQSPHSNDTSKIKSPRELSMHKLTGSRAHTSDFHYTIHENMVRDLSYLGTEDQHRSPKFRLPEIVDNKYLQRRVNKMVNNLNKDMKSTEKLDASSLPLLSTLHQASNLSSTKNIGIIDQSASINSSYFGNSSKFNPDSDKFMVHQHYKLLHIESTISKMVERHNESQKKILETANKVLTNFEKKTKKVIDANSKAPVLLDNIKENNTDAIEVLMRKTNSMFRKRKRIAQYWRERYENAWDKYHDMNTQKVEENLETIRNNKDNREDYYDYLITTNRIPDALSLKK